MTKTRIAAFLKALESGDLETVCADEMKFLRDHYSTINSVKAALTPYRNALRLIDVKHPALALMRQSPQELAEAKRAYNRDVSNRQRSIRKITDVDGYLTMAESMLSATHYIDRLLGLAALTGRRTSELLCTAQLERVNDYEAIFTGQLKTKGRESDAYPIPLLSDFDTINSALIALQREQKDLRGDPTKAKNRTGKAISVRMRRDYFTKYLGADLIGRDLRRAYAAIAFAVSGLEGEITSQKYASDILGHGADDNTTGGAYMDFIVVSPYKDVYNGSTN